MNRIETTLTRLRHQQRKALAPFITAGDPERQVTVPALHALVQGGADILEVGVPFSDPEADGPEIQAASERALRQQVSLLDVFDQVAEFRRRNADTPIVLMGYLNTILAMGEANFVTRAAKAGVDGMIVVNLPPEEAATLRSALAEAQMDLILLAAPTSTSERLTRIAEAASGFLYLVSLKGITGADHIDVSTVASLVARVREVSALPLLVGFGIKDGHTARAVAAHADGVVVGAALVSRMAELANTPTAIPAMLKDTLGDIRRALDR